MEKDEAAQSSNKVPGLILRADPDGLRLSIFADELVVELPHTLSKYTGMDLFRCWGVYLDFSHASALLWADLSMYASGR